MIKIGNKRCAILNLKGNNRKRTKESMICRKDLKIDWLAIWASSFLDLNLESAMEVIIPTLLKRKMIGFESRPQNRPSWAIKQTLVWTTWQKRPRRRRLRTLTSTT